MLYLIFAIIVLVVIFIGFYIGASSQSRNIPPELKEEIDMVKQAYKSGKSSDEIQEMRRKKFDRGGGIERERKRPGLGAAGAGAAGALGEGAAEGVGEKSAGGAPGRSVKIKCPKCDKIQTVPSSKRPIEFSCTNCGMKLVLKK